MIKNQKIKNKKNKKAFTLIEVLLYIGLTSVIILTLSTFFTSLVQQNTRNDVITEVNTEGQRIMQIISQTVRNATLVNTPSVGTPAATLSINVTTASLSPTIFDLNGGYIRIKEGAAANLNLSSNNVVASNFTVTNLTKTSTKSIVRFTFTLAYRNLSGKSEQNYSQTFYGSASLRQ